MSTLKILMYKLCLVWFFIFILFTTIRSFAIELNSSKMIDAICYTESDNKNVTGKFGEVGVMQISKGVLDDYNRYNKTEYRKKDLLEKSICKKVGRWQWSINIPRLLKVNGLSDNLYNRALVYTCGIKKAKKYLRAGYTPRRVRIWLKRIKNYIKGTNKYS